MISRSARRSAWLAAGVLIFAAAPVHAFRCGNKLVTEGMGEAEVVAACGEPMSRRELGYVERSYWFAVPGGLRHGQRGLQRLSEEVLVTELVYNFGPRRLMRRLVFEGGWLVEIEKLGYGYRD